eukprot:3263324-Alexandrium_andersonii.AAC.1
MFKDCRKLRHKLDSWDIWHDFTRYMNKHVHFSDPSLDHGKAVAVMSEIGTVLDKVSSSQSFPEIFMQCSKIA